MLNTILDINSINKIKTFASKEVTSTLSPSKTVSFLQSHSYNPYIFAEYLLSSETLYQAQGFVKRHNIRFLTLKTIVIKAPLTVLNIW